MKEQSRLLELLSLKPPQQIMTESLDSYRNTIEQHNREIMVQYESSLNTFLEEIRQNDGIHVSTMTEMYHQLDRRAKEQEAKISNLLEKTYEETKRRTTPGVWIEYEVKNMKNHIDYFEKKYIRDKIFLGAPDSSVILTPLYNDPKRFMEELVGQVFEYQSIRLTGVKVVSVDSTEDA
jgi:hypothetical protein